MIEFIYLSDAELVATLVTPRSKIPDPRCEPATILTHVCVNLGIRYLVISARRILLGGVLRGGPLRVLMGVPGCARTIPRSSSFTPVPMLIVARPPPSVSRLSTDGHMSGGLTLRTHGGAAPTRGAAVRDHIQDLS